MRITNYSRMGFALSAALLGTLTGCVTHVDEPRHARVHTSPPPVLVVVQDDYVYYPRYQVYYSRNRHQYVYLEGRSWVTRPAPRHVSVEVLFASPSVRLDFHDAPSAHHTTVVRHYPKHWTPPQSNPNLGEGHRDDEGGNRPGDRK